MAGAIQFTSKVSRHRNNSAGSGINTSRTDPLSGALLGNLSYAFVTTSFPDDIHQYLFFFSRRRQHTRSTRDWSSDVCSSDLRQRRRPERPALAIQRAEVSAGLVARRRSEERRVGKECRSQWTPHH